MKNKKGKIIIKMDIHLTEDEQKIRLFYVKFAFGYIRSQCEETF